jgi:hypothetical protein
MSQKIVVLFNLKPGVSATDYEEWARDVDLPSVRALTSVEGFEVFKTTGLLGTDQAPPYSYIEILDISDMQVFGGEVATETMQKVAGQFQAMADNPLFILTEKLG